MMQALLIYTFFSIVFDSHYCDSSFIIGETSLPRATDATAVGYDASTDTILLVGGYTTSTNQQFVKFKDHTFTDMGDTYLSTNHYTYGYSQHYTQINNELWMIDPDGSSFIKFNTETHTAETPSITIPSNVGDDACLTSTDTHLIVIRYTSVQIYSINEDKWLSNIPSLQSSRRQFTCDVVNDKVYAIGGWDGWLTSYDSIEVLDLSNINTISSQSWQYISGRLSTARDGVRSVVYGTDIYVIGGHYGNSFYTDINIIDTTTDECYVGESLAYIASYSSPIIVGNILYVFGGLASEYPVIIYESRYQYSILPTLTDTTTTDAPLETTSKYAQTSTEIYVQTQTEKYVQTSTEIYVQTPTEKHVETSTFSSSLMVRDAMVQTFIPTTTAADTDSSDYSNKTSLSLTPLLTNIIVALSTLCVVVIIGSILVGVVRSCYDVFYLKNRLSKSDKNVDSDGDDIFVEAADRKRQELTVNKEGPQLNNVESQSENIEDMFDDNLKIEENTMPMDNGEDNATDAEFEDADIEDLFDENLMIEENTMPTDNGENTTAIEAVQQYDHGNVDDVAVLQVVADVNVNDFDVKKDNAGHMEHNSEVITTICAMKQDKIVLGIMSTNKDGELYSTQS